MARGIDVPKVSDEYFTNKKKTIVEAAIRVCKSKPAYSVTMRDVVKECGISQGGIYNYFSNIDEIFAEIIDLAVSGKTALQSELDAVFKGDYTPDEVLIESFALIGRAIDRVFDQYRSLIHDINVIQLLEPARMATIGCKANNEFNIFFGKLDGFIKICQENGSFRSNVPKEHIVFLIIVAVTAITKAITFPDEFSIQMETIGLVGDEYTNAEAMMKVLARTIAGMLVY